MICGNCSASKKSGACRWPLSCATGTSTLETSTAPLSVPSTSSAESSAKWPRKVAMPEWRTAKPALEWTGSRFQVPVGMVVCSMVLMVVSLLGSGC